MSDAHFASLVASRICHDLISPVGAIDNGLELLEAMGPGGQRPEFAMIAQSAQAASVKLRFLRLAFGRIPEGDDTACSGFSDLLVGALEKPRHRIVTAIHGNAVPRRNAQLLSLIAMCMQSAMPRGGELLLSLDATSISALAKSDDIRAAGPNWDALESNGAITEETPSAVEFGFLIRLLSERGLSARIRRDEAQAEISIAQG